MYCGRTVLRCVSFVNFRAALGLLKAGPSAGAAHCIMMGNTAVTLSCVECAHEDEM